MVAKKLANSPLTFSPKRYSVSERFGLHAGHRLMDDAVDVALRFLQERNVVLLRSRTHCPGRPICAPLESVSTRLHERRRVWRAASQIGRATRYAYGALGTGKVNWKVAPGPASREAHIRPP